MRPYCKILMIVALIMLHCSLSAQNAFIYGLQGDKQYVYEDSSLIVIGFKSLEYTCDSVEIATIIETIDANAQHEMLTPRMMKFQTDIHFDSIVNILSVHNNELIVSKVYYPISDNHIHWCNNRVVVMLQSMDLLQSLLEQLSIKYEEINIFNKGTYVITLSGIEDKSIQVSNMLYETGQVISAQPDFYFAADPNNAYYCDQWGLHNIGQYETSYSDIDIKAPEAWNITRGDNVKVAVIDCGVDLNHPVLRDL